MTRVKAVTSLTGRGLMLAAHEEESVALIQELEVVQLVFWGFCVQLESVADTITASEESETPPLPNLKCGLAYRKKKQDIKEWL